MKRCDVGRTRELETNCEFFAQFVITAQCHENAEDQFSCFKHIGVFVHQGADCTGSFVRPFVKKF